MTIIEVKKKLVDETDFSVKKEINYYQAIGWLYGNVTMTIVDGMKLFHIELEGTKTRYQLFSRHKTFYAFFKEVSDNQNKLHICCHPNSSINDRNLTFNVVYFSKFEPQYFKNKTFWLSGVWQKIPQLNDPVFSIFRNERRRIKDNLKSQHLPVIWSEKPYIVTKSSKDGARFYKIETELDEGNLVWKKTISVSPEKPRRVKLKSKKNQPNRNKNELKTSIKPRNVKAKSPVVLKKKKMK